MLKKFTVDFFRSCWRFWRNGTWRCYRLWRRQFPCGIQQSLVCGTGGWVPIPALLDAVLELFPIDTFVPQPVKLMQVVPGDDYVPEVVEEYKKILAKHDVGEDKIEYLERFDFTAIQIQRIV